MYKNVLLRNTFILTMIISLLCLSTEIKAQVSPHPKLLQKIKSGLMSAPDVIGNKAALRARGIDAPWTSKELQAKKLSSPDFPRSYGPLNAPTGSWKALAILVQFSDKLKQVEGTYFDNMLFGSGSGTLKDYYKKVTYNNLDIVTVNLPSAMGWKFAPQTYAYYCNGNFGTGNYPNNSQKLVEDIITLVNPSVDFSQYDNDKDGNVDALFIIHTGPGAEYTGSKNDIWSHAWSIQPKLMDGVNISRYSIEPEYWSNPGDMTMGVYAHELGHAAFGLPDLYDRDYTSRGLGFWSLMASGSWGGENGDSPTYPDAYNRIEMGYVTPVVITENVLSQSIPDAENNNVVYKLWKGGVPGKEYFLVENRQRTSFDLALPDGGLLIYHVDENVSTQNDNEWYPGNTSYGHYLVALEQADGFFELEQNMSDGDSGDPFPGSENNCNFTNFSTPDSKEYNFQSTGVAVKNITASSTTMTADFVVFSTDTLLAVVSPNGGEQWAIGHTQQIILNAQNTGTVKVEYTTDNGVNWLLIGNTEPVSKPFAGIGKGISNNGSLAEMEADFTGSVIDWVVPNSPSSLCKIKATSISNPSRCDQSDNTFSIVTAPTTETEPNNTPATANLMGYGDSLNAAVTPIGDIDYYKFEASAGDTISIYTETRNSSELWGRIILYDENMNFLAWNDNYGSYEKQKIIYPVYQAGTYYIRYAYNANFEGSAVNPKSNKNLHDPVNLMDRNKKSPELASNIDGEYRIALNRFTPAAPELGYFYPMQCNYNSIRLQVTFFTNGLNTTAKLDYGKTISLGTSINLTPVPVNSLSEEYVDCLAGSLDPNTPYYFRVTLTNSEGSCVSPIYEISTYSVPEGWAFQTSGTENHLLGVSFADANHGTAAGYGGTILRTTNSGTDWNFQNSGITYDLHSVSFSDLNNGAAAGFGYGNYGPISIILKTTNAGSIWSDKSSGYSESLYGVSFTDANNGTVVGGNGIILRTTDGGTTWSQQQSGTSYWLYGVSFTDANNGTAVGEYGTILRTTNGGTNWIQQTSGVTDILYSVSFSDVNNGTAVGASGLILRTTNGGTTWVKQNGGGYWLYGVSFSDANNGAAVGDYGTILITADGGDTWIRQSTGTDGPFWGVSVKGKSITAVGLFGTILRSLNYLKLVSPNGGQVWKVGTSRNITWTNIGVSNIKIDYTTNNGTNWTVISSGTPASAGSFSWTVPNTLSQQCRVRITDLANSSLFDESDNTFTISLTGPDAETEPNNTMETSNNISYGDTLEASVNPPGDVDYYKFSANAGEEVTIHTIDINGSDLDGAIQLFDSNGSSLAFNDDYQNSILESEVIYQFRTSGTYYIKYAYYRDFSLISEKTVSGPGLPGHYGNIPKAPQLSSYTGDYRITVSLRENLPPAIVGFEGYPRFHNAIRLRLTYNSNGTGTTARIDYGATASYGNSIPLIETPENFPFDATVEYLLEGLDPDTPYHFRVVLTNSMGVTESPDQEIRTLPVSENWTLQTSGTKNDLHNAFFIDANTGFAVGTLGTILKTTNGGDSWVKQTSGIRNDLMGVYFKDSNNGIIVGGSGTVLVTADGGTTWTSQNLGVTNYLLKVLFTDANHGIIIGSGIILRTADGGATWTTQSGTTSLWLWGISFTDVNNGTVVGTDGIIVRTTDGGATWIPQTSGNTFILWDVFFTDVNNGIIVGGNGTETYGYGEILRTTNGGDTWTPQTSGVSTGLLGVSFKDQSHGIAVGMDGKIIRSSDAGITWNQENSGTDAKLWRICTKENQTYIVGDYGTILKERPRGPVVWQTDIKVSDNTETKTLTFGQATTATDGIDESLGEQTLPPAPPSSFDARFSLPVNPLDYSIKDYRRDTLKSIDWRVNFQAGSGGLPVTLSWNPSSLPEGTFTMKDVVNGSIININMKEVDTLRITDPDVTSLRIEFRKSLCMDVSFSSGWNMISVPVRAVEMNTRVLFPDYTSHTFYYAGGYQDVTSLELSKGYWIKYAGAKTYQVCGEVTDSLSVPVKAGWNMIGVYDKSVPVLTDRNKMTTPQGIISSNFFEYKGSYQIPLTLEPGKGYWVKASGPGVINLKSTSGLLAKKGLPKNSLMKALSSEISPDWGRVIVEDNSGSKATLYRSKGVKDLAAYELPPVPPMGVFDVRYSSDRYVDDISEVSRLKITSATYPIRLKAEEADLRVRIKGVNTLSKLIKKGESLELSSPVDVIEIESVEIPLSYSLSQNYPNPFNPATTIRYTVPEKVEVRLTVYNQLGQRVVELIHEVKDPGEYELEWNASRLSSGIYFYELRARDFRDVKKLVLLK